MESETPLALTVYAVDSAGNRSVGRNVTLLLDTVAPTLVADVGFGRINQINASDQNGIASVYVEVFMSANQILLVSAEKVGTSWRAELPDADGAPYRFVIVAIDNAGNVTRSTTYVSTGNEPLFHDHSSRSRGVTAIVRYSERHE